MPVRPATIPVLRYADAPAAIDFLCKAFGFERHAVYADPDDASRVFHAQLTREGQMVMLASAEASDFAGRARLRTPAEAGGVTQTIYVVLDDVDAHAAAARAAGADIFAGPEDQSYGGRGYSARDPEGNVWSFGSYDPFA
ncbi:putative glyoxalase superfamily protein PhnB [Amaricoccus macauensis]|uniref:Putative glyoxalase superfamily protein PhnB n=1 Tax=Amaricoccus macauensis TaxID=57001 RepID=A0A840SLQ9_9RHOB|nr:VOC family protein [Amaricoccus macauensis]MBB5220796.1 putative glyoxalase superfamily protein PhnB [Amaricoccus macauensis]